MHCTNCAITIRKYLEKEGMKDVRVNFGTGDVAFETGDDKKQQEITEGIRGLGYQVAGTAHADDHGHHSKGWLKTPRQQFLFCLPFTAILMLHMFPSLNIHWLMDPCL